MYVCISLSLYLYLSLSLYIYIYNTIYIYIYTHTHQAVLCYTAVMSPNADLSSYNTLRTNITYTHMTSYDITFDNGDYNIMHTMYHHDTR